METFPVKTVHTTQSIGPKQIPTQFIINRYVNMIMIIMTQTGKIGSLTMGQKHQSTDTTADCSTLLGDRNDLIPSIYANQLCEMIGGSTPVLLGCSLLPCETADEESYHRDTLQDAVVVLKELAVL
jgi:hypothetical protein